MLALGLLLAAGLGATRASERLDNLVYDGFVRAADPPARDDILIVALDERSLEELGPWPWPRRVHAEIVERLAAAGPRAIAYDVLFVDPSADPADDQRLAAAIAASGGVCLPVLFETPGDNGAAFRVRPPAADLGRVASLAHVNVQLDPDGVARHAVLYEGDGRRALPHLMECVRRLGRGESLMGRPLPAPRSDTGLVQQSRILVPYGEPGRFRTVSAAAVHAGELPDSFVRGRHVLVGATAAGLHDRHATPATARGETMPGIEMSANLLQALLSGSVVQRASLPAELAFALAGVTAMMLLLTILPPRRALPLGFGLVAAALGVSFVLFRFAQVWLPPFPLILSLLLVFPLWGWRRLEAVSGYLLEELQAFAAEPEPLFPQPRRRPGDPVARQVQLLRETLRRARDLRRFTADTLDSLPDPTFVVGQGGDVLFANGAARRAAQTAGGPADQAPGLAAGWTDLEGEAVDLFRPEGEGLSSQEVLSPDGRPHLATVAPYRDSQGRLAAWIVRLTDISDLRAAEAQRERLIQLLSHDMRSPQNSILALLETSPRSAVAADLRERIEAFARRTLALATDFVHLARAGSAELQFELADLSDIATDAVDELWPQARQVGVTLRLEGADREHLVLGARDLLTRAVVNLLDNAIKYRGEGREALCRLERITLDGAPGVRLSVIDQGVGLSPEQQETLFRPFRRHHVERLRGATGVGLGLSLVWEVARRHGGRVTCQSAPAQGACFSVELPLAPEEES